MSCVNIALNTGDHMDRTALFACSVFPSTLRTMSLSSQESANSAIIKMRNQSLINLYRSCSSLSPKGGSWSCFSLIACTQNCNTFITQCIRFQSFNSFDVNIQNYVKWNDTESEIITKRELSVVNLITILISHNVISKLHMTRIYWTNIIYNPYCTSSNTNYIPIAYNQI